MYTLLICFWPLLQLVYSNLLKVSPSNKEKVTRNIVAFSNALGTLTLGLLYYYSESETVFNLTVLYPTIYYLYDTYLIINKNFYAEYPYIYHHIITIYLLENLFFADDTLKYILLNILISAELSNLPIYPVYHIIKTGNKEDKNYYSKLTNWKLFQIIWYIIIRIIYFSFVIYYKYYKINNFILRNLALTIYLLGLYWVYGQINSLKEDYKKLALVKKD